MAGPISPLREPSPFQGEETFLYNLKKEKNCVPFEVQYSSSRGMVQTMCSEVYLIWQKKIIENRDKSKITKHLIFPICFMSKGDSFQFFTNLIILKLISELI